MPLVLAEPAGSLAKNRLFQRAIVAVIERKINGNIERSEMCHCVRPSRRSGRAYAQTRQRRVRIRERIAQVKAEMEAARARVLAEANLDNTRYRL